MNVQILYSKEADKFLKRNHDNIKENIGAVSGLEKEI